MSPPLFAILYMITPQNRLLELGLSSPIRVPHCLSDCTNCRNYERLVRHQPLHAGVFEAKRVLTGDGFERTFQINVLSPYLLTGMLMPRIAATAAAGETGEADVRVLNVTSISQSPGVEWDNLHAQKSFTSHGSYCHSKTCIRVFSFELHERMQRAAAKETSGEQMRSASSELAAAGAAALGQVVVLTCDPGTVNTKMLLAGWGPCGVETFQANDQFSLLTAPRFRDEDARGGYYVNLHMKQRPKPRAAHDAVVEEREKLWGILEQMTGFEYPF